MTRPASSIRPTSRASCSIAAPRSARITRTAAPSCPIACGSTPTTSFTTDWLPSTCAYRLRANGEPLPDWHYLVSGDREAVHRAGESTRGWTVSEDDAGDLEFHLVDRKL